MMLAGHETTANSLTWTLFELCKHPDIQARLRAEIRETELLIQQRGGNSFAPKDYDSMVYLNAVLKVRWSSLTMMDN
jgi:cytochrome P450